MTGYFYVPVADLVKPTDGECLCDHWWAVHPERGVAFYFQGHHVGRAEYSPMANRNKDVADMVIPKVLPGHDLKQIPVAFLESAYEVLPK